MKLSIGAVIVALAISQGAAAQVNLDQPVAIGTGDHVYRSSADSNVVYAFPLYLEVSGEPRLDSDSKYVTAHFTARVSSSSLDAIAKVINAGQATPKSVRVLRGLNASVVPQSGTDIPAQFESELIAAGDPGGLAEPTEYALRLKNRRGARSVLNELMRTSAARHVGTVRYQFNATQGGVPYIGQTAVGVFVGQLHIANVSGAARQSFVLASVNRVLAPADAHGVAVTDSVLESAAVSSIQVPSTGIAIQMDGDTKCWGTPVPGVICLRPKS